ncbi:unnamed protein product [Dibothriocephalus latus]|uniref:Reverse transcriptase domain-containing protein n=1 Tax=Dibothriocephalus latus TaxID=60516 RepID=A0A3P6U4Q1_DIBLA|nr:unnamed protein product [Dibothriocephalus latus]
MPVFTSAHGLCSPHRVLIRPLDTWVARKGEEIQGYADHNEWKNFFAAIKAVYGHIVKGRAPLLSTDGPTLLAERALILKRWTEQIQNILNRLSSISEAAIDRMPQETIKAVQQPSSGKASDSDASTAEVYKYVDHQLINRLTTLFQEMWTTIVHIYKRNGNSQLCDNHHGILLFNIAGKIFARVLNHLNNHLEQGLLPESQCIFSRHSCTTDMIFAVQQLQEKRQDMRTYFYTLSLKQGCVLVPTLCSFMFSAILIEAFYEEHPGIRINCRTNGHILNVRRMQAPTRVPTTTVHDLLFADDRTLNNTRCKGAWTSSPQVAQTSASPSTRIKRWS